MLRWSKAWVVARKDLSEFRRNRIILGSLIAMPIIFSVLMPITVVVPFQYRSFDPDDLQGYQFPDNVTAEEAKRIVMEQSLDYLLPMFMIIPAMIPTIVASYSFVGEKLNRSLEPLLATPLTDLELFMGKCAAVFVPSMIATLASFVAFAAITDIALWPSFGFPVLPNLKWAFIITVVAPLLCILSIEANVYISSRVRDVRAAEQLGALVVMPLLLLVILFSVGAIQLSPLLLPALAGFLVLLDGALFFIATKTFQRERILTEWK